MGKRSSSYKKRNGPDPPKSATKKETLLVAFSRGNNNLTKTEAEFLHYFNDLGYTVSQIASRRGCSKQYVRKVRLKLSKSGWLRKVAPPPLNPPEDCATTATKRGDTSIGDSTIRLHAQKFRIELVKPISKKYLTKKAGLVFSLDGNNVQCFNSVVCVQAKNKSFNGADEDSALEESMDYWYRFFARLENDLGVLFMKNRKQNIKQTYCEWATTNSELARECEKKAKRIRIYAMDNKLRYTTDWSKTHEHEAHHFLTGKEDSEVGNRFINDVLDHPEAPTFTQLVKVTLLIAQQQKEASAGLHSIINLLKPINEENMEGGRPDYFG